MAAGATDPAWARGLNGGWSSPGFQSGAWAAYKGPVIVITVVLALLAFHFAYRHRVGSWRSHLAGIAFFLIIALPWPIYILQHVPNAATIWRYESVGEVTGENIEKVRPWWMYIANSFQLPLPWTPLWIGGIVVTFVHGRRGIRSPRGKRRMIAILWQALTVLFFSFSGVKKPAYLLPAMPCQALIVLEAIVVLLAFAKRRVRYLSRSRDQTQPPSPGTPGEG